MDLLENLPTTDDKVELKPQHEAVMNKYFGTSSSSKSSEIHWKDVNKWKTVGMAAVAFLALANPWVRGILARAPYFGDNDMTTMILALLLFVILMITIVMFAC